MKHPKYIVIHHSESPDHNTLDWAGIRNWHTCHNKWRAIGYHFGLERIGKQYETLVGRMPTDTGAHCRGKNRKSWGVCIIGNFDHKVPPPVQWKLAVKFAASLTELADIPVDNVLGHREGDPTTNKTCPGRCFDMDKFRKDVFEYRALHT